MQTKVLKYFLAITASQKPFMYIPFTGQEE